MYYVSAHGADERMMNVLYYYCYGKLHILALMLHTTAAVNYIIVGMLKCTVECAYYLPQLLGN